MSQTDEIYNYFYHKEQWIQICRKIKYSQVFKGGITLTWGNVFQSKETEDPMKQKELKQLLEKSLDYRDMFGLCPVKIVKDRITGQKKPIIPEFGTGAFILVFNIRKFQIEEIAFAPFGGGLVSSYNKKQIDSSVKVFVWPGREPSLHNKQFKSAIFTVFEEFLIIEELKRNALDADYNSSHPTIFTQSRPDSKNLSELTEEEVFGEVGDPMMNPSEKHTYRRDTFRALRLEDMTKKMNCQSKFQTSWQTDSSLTKRVDSTSKITQFQRKRIWEDSIEALPEGEEMAHSIIPQTRKDFIEWQNRYEDQVCLIMGIPKVYIAGRTAKFKTDAQQELEIVRSTVTHDREDANVFYQFVYEWMYRESDDKKIIQTLMTLNNIKKSNPESEQQQQLKQSKKNIKKIGSMPNRIEILFNEDPFSRTVDLNNVQFAADRDAITAEEEVNSIRSTLGLEKVTPDDELVNMRKIQRDIKRQELKIQLENLKLQLKESKNRIQHEDENNKLLQQQQSPQPQPQSPQQQPQSQQQGSIKKLNSSNNILSKKQKIQEALIPPEDKRKDRELQREFLQRSLKSQALLGLKEKMSSKIAPGKAAKATIPQTTGPTITTATSTEPIVWKDNPNLPILDDDAMAKLWKSTNNIPSISVKITDMDPMLDASIWTETFDVEEGKEELISPRDVLVNKNISPQHWAKIMNADLKFPILVIWPSNATAPIDVLDGFHRLTKATLQGHDTIEVIPITRQQMEDATSKKQKLQE